MGSTSLLVVIVLVALGATMIGWRRMLVMTVTAGVAFAVLGVAELVSLLGLHG